MANYSKRYPTELEEVINHTLDNNINILYPYNKIDNITSEQVRTDYFYCYNNLWVELQRLEKGGQILNLRVFYE